MKGEMHDDTTKIVSQTSGIQSRPVDEYKYIAQSGDTYTQLARKAIQTYGIADNVKLSPAQIIFAETSLALEAGSVELNEGSATTLKKETVKKWVEAAQKLSDADQALWQNICTVC